MTGYASGSISRAGRQLTTRINLRPKKSPPPAGAGAGYLRQSFQRPHAHLLLDLYRVRALDWGAIKCLACKLGFYVTALKFQIFSYDLDDQIREPVVVYVSGFSRRVPFFIELNTSFRKRDRSWIDLRGSIE